MHIFGIAIFYILIFLLVITSYIPIIYTITDGLAPIFETALVFYFISRKKYDISFLFLLLIFFTLDTIQNHIIGTSALIFFLTMIIFNFLEKLFHFDKFSELWIGYCCFCFIIFLLYFIVSFFNEGINVITINIILKYISTIAFYPIFDMLISYILKISIFKFPNEKYLI